MIACDLFFSVLFPVTFVYNISVFTSITLTFTSRNIFKINKAMYTASIDLNGLWINAQRVVPQLQAGRRICYDCTSPHGNYCLDYSECIWRLSPPSSPCCFLFIEHAPLRWQASFSPLLISGFGVNRVSIVRDHCRRLPTAWYPCISLSFLLTNG